MKTRSCRASCALNIQGEMYHVMSRGNRRQDIFLDDLDRHDFLKTLAEACQKTAWEVHAFCLMSNHYHLVLETPNGNLVAGMPACKAPTPFGSTIATSSLATSSAVDTKPRWSKAAAMFI